MRPKTLLLLSILSYLLTFYSTAQENKNIFIFGHSLIVHDPPINPTPSNETTVPHWLHFLAEADTNTIAVSGQYGFLPQHANLPPISQWGFDYVTPAWESDTEPFSDANFNTILLTAGNFIQDQPSNVAYYNNPNMTPVSATVDIIDWVNQQNVNTPIYIYENWPDMAGFLNNGFPASNTEFQNYNSYTENAFNDWWLDYQDFLIAERPDETIKMIPVGPIISKLLSQAPYNQIPITELYEDDAPHGMPTIYFLAAIITYSAIYQTPTPSNFTVPNTVNNVIASNYSNITNFIWNELLAFNFDANGESRVFTDNSLSVSDFSLTDISIYPNPTDHILYFNTSINDVKIECYDVLGKNVDLNWSVTDRTIDTSILENGVWFIKIISDEIIMTKKIIKI